MTGTRDTRNLQIIDPVLSDIAVHYKPAGMVYDEIVSSHPVDVDAGQYPVFDESFFFADSEVNSKVADRAQTPEIDYSWSTDTYLCEDYRLKVSISDKERRQVNDALRLEQSKTERLMLAMALRREVRLATKLLKTNGGNGGKLNLGNAATAHWDLDTATIEADIKAGSLAVYDATGMSTNTIVIPYKVAYAAAIQQDIRQILQYTVNGLEILQLGDRLLPSVLHGHKVIVPKVQKNLNKPGRTKSLTEVWGTSCRLLHINPSAGWGDPTVAYSFKSRPEQVDRWRENDPPVDYIRAWEAVDEKIVAPDLGYELSGCL